MLFLPAEFAVPQIDTAKSISLSECTISYLSLHLLMCAQLKLFGTGQTLHRTALEDYSLRILRVSRSENILDQILIQS